MMRLRFWKRLILGTPPRHDFRSSICCYPTHQIGSIRFFRKPWMPRKSTSHLVTWYSVFHSFQVNALPQPSLNFSHPLIASSVPKRLHAIRSKFAPSALVILNALFWRSKLPRAMRNANVNDSATFVCRVAAVGIRRSIATLSLALEEGRSVWTTIVP